MTCSASTIFGFFTFTISFFFLSYRGTYRSQEVAIKVLKPERVNVDMQREFAQEVYIMRLVGRNSLPSGSIFHYLWPINDQLNGHSSMSHMSQFYNLSAHTFLFTYITHTHTHTHMLLYLSCVCFVDFNSHAIHMSCGLSFEDKMFLHPSNIYAFSVSTCASGFRNLWAWHTVWGANTQVSWFA